MRTYNMNMIRSTGLELLWLNSQFTCKMYLFISSNRRAYKNRQVKDVNLAYSGGKFSEISKPIWFSF